MALGFLALWHPVPQCSMLRKNVAKLDQMKASGALKEICNAKKEQ